jgi:hypothetical protein
MSDIEFISGLSFKAPNDNAPEYVKAKGSIKVADLKAWLDTKDGEWVNFDLKVSNGGKWYAAVDNWKPSGERQAPKAKQAPAGDAPFPDDDIPF